MYNWLKNLSIVITRLELLLKIGSSVIQEKKLQVNEYL